MSVTAKDHSPTSIRVAIIDDHRMVVDGVAAHLSARRHGIHVVIGEATWDGFLRHPEFPVDVAVLDLNLDDTISIGAKIRALSAAGTSTIVMSRHTDPSSIHGAIKAGAMAFIPKTETADELVLAIRAAALGRHYQNGSFAAGSSITPAPDPGLGRQELRAIMYYASGRSIREVAGDMGTTEETVKSYIKRARRKYRLVDIDLGTKILLRRHGIREGWLNAE